MNGNLSPSHQTTGKGRFLLLLALLGGTLAVLCHKGFLPYQVFWANDLPLGALMESSARLPASFLGSWSDFYWLGGQNAAFPPDLTNLCMAIFSPEHLLKFYAPLSMFFLGFGAWFFFRQLRFAPMVCVLGGLGAGLNMHFFSNACWGLGWWNVACGMIFIALGLLVSPRIRPLWIKAVLAGLCVGMAVMEGLDVGAILSIYTGVFLVFLFLTNPGRPAQRATRTVLVGGLVVVSAILISLSSIFTLVATQIKGTGGTGPSAADKEGRWVFITQWSIPKLETLRVIIPGVFGCRMQEYTTSTNKAGAYWGRIAEDPHIQGLESGDPQVRTNAAAALNISPQIQAILAGNDLAARQSIIDQVKGQLQRRHTGNGEYAGVLVCLLAALGLANAWRKSGSLYSAEERRAVWFWGAAALFSLPMAWGRFGFVYPFVYHVISYLPFPFSYLANIRNPMKFMHPLNISLIILCGYGLETLYRGSLAQPSSRAGSLPQRLGGWWKRASGFEKKWAFGSGLAVLAAALGWAIVNSSKPELTNYLARNGFDATLSSQIAAFCIGEVGLFVLFLALSVGVVLIVLSGAWTGPRAVWAWSFLSAIIIVDLARADAPWVRYYNYKEKFSLNAVVALLRQDPWEHRVVSRLSPMGPYDMSQDANFAGLCHWWLENDYPVNDIESLEIDQAPRMPVRDSNYLNAFIVHSNSDLSPATRLWRLTNTRYIFADARLEAAFNQLSEPKNSFRSVLRVNMIVKPGITDVEDAGDMTVETNSNGSLALMEDTRVLPRAKLFANWQVMDDPAALRALNSVEFDPEKTVLVARETPLAEKPGAPDADPGTVKITTYHSTHPVLQAEARTPAVLLLNDYWDEYWHVWVDDKPAALLRCNYIMQGVFVPAGRHTIDFRFEPPLGLFYVSLTTIVLGILLSGYVIITLRRRGAQDPPPPSAPGVKTS
jgi:hypothetical protein